MHDGAGRRLHVARVVTLPRHLSAVGVEPRRLAASMLIPLHRAAAEAIIKTLGIGTRAGSEFVLNRDQGEMP